MNIKDFELLLAVSKCKSITKVAEEQYISQPALSQRIKALEKEIGIPMLKRTSHGIEVTEKGLIAMKYLKDMVILHHNLIEQLESKHSYSCGRIVLGITSYLGTMILPTFITKFHEVYPNIEIDIIEDTSKNMDQYILDGRVDVAFLHEPLHQTPYQIVPLQSSDFVAVVSKTHRLAKTPLSFIDPILLKNEDFITLMPEQRIRQISDAICAQCHFSPKIKFKTKSFETARDLVAAGYGVSLLPRDYLEFFYTEHNPICLKLIPNLTYSWSTCIAYSCTIPLTQCSRMFIDFASQYFKEDAQ